tara:strand:- start:749 stop:1102 length:354 start_codon:yes stop_codon:yes gene_type:complete
MAIFIADNDKDILKLLNTVQHDDSKRIHKYKQISSSCHSNTYLKDVLNQYKKYFELKLNEKIAQEKALVIIINHLDKILQNDNYNKEQRSHIDKQKDDIFRELYTVQDTIKKISQLK